MPWTRRTLLKSIGGAAAALVLSARARGFGAEAFPHARPAPADRKFQSPAVEQFLADTSRRIADPALATLFLNCFPNTLDTTVEPGTFRGKPDTVVVTGDIAAMWLRDSSAQVWPYLSLAKKDPALADLLAGVIRRQVRCLQIDTYANAFMADLNAPPLPWSRDDKTEMKRGVGERKYELDSLCYPIRLAHGYWKQTGDTRPFDRDWQQAMQLIVATMRTQQRRHGRGPYHFERTSEVATETLPNAGYGNPVNPVGLIASGFRPSDDACTFPFLVPANLFAVTSLRQLAEMAHTLLADASLHFRLVVAAPGQRQRNEGSDQAQQRDQRPGVSFAPIRDPLFAPGQGSRNEQNGERSDIEEGYDGRDDPDRCQKPCFQGRAPEVPERLHNDRDHHGLNAVENACDLGQTRERPIDPGDAHHEQERRDNEADARQQQPVPLRQPITDMDREFGRTGAGNQVRSAEQIQELLLRQPLTPLHDLRLHQRDMRGRSAERSQPEPKKQERKPGKRRGRRRLRIGNIRCRVMHSYLPSCR